MTFDEGFPIIQDLVRLSTHEDIEYVFFNRGFNGYKYSYKAKLKNQYIATISFGSNNELQNKRPMLHIEGRQCHFFNFKKFHHYLGAINGARITRNDICADFFDKELTIESVRKAHLNNEFKLPNSINPKIEPIGEIQPDGTNPGRTLYIGSRKSSKFVRFYEKGYQYFDFENVVNICHQWSKNIDDDPIPPDEMDIYMAFKDGRKLTAFEINSDQPFNPKDWIRAEVQFRNGNSIIPLNSIIDTDDFFAGAYPFCKGLIMNETTQRTILEKDINLEVLDLKKRISNHKAISGRLINDLKLIGWSNDQIVNYLIDQKGPSQQLIKSGIEFKS